MVQNCKQILKKCLFGATRTVISLVGSNLAIEFYPSRKGYKRLQIERSRVQSWPAVNSVKFGILFIWLNVYKIT